MSNQPDFRLTVSPKYDPNDDNRISTTIGAAWRIEKDGKVVGISIKLDKSMPPILLSNRFDLTLWRNEPKEEKQTRNNTPPPQDDFDDFDDSTIPF